MQKISNHLVKNCPSNLLKKCAALFCHLKAKIPALGHFSHIIYGMCGGGCSDGVDISKYLEMSFPHTYKSSSGIRE